MRTLIGLLLWLAGSVGAVGLALYAFVFDVWTVPSDDPQLAVSV